MAKYEQPFEDTQEMYNRAIDAANLNQYMNITILVNNKAKDIFKVAKCSETEKFKTQDDVNIFINEKLFEGLTPAQRLIVVEESIAAIHFDTESDTITLTKPDVVTFSGILRKYTFDTWNTLRESIKSLKDKEKEDEDQRKAQTEKAKSDKTKKFIK